MQHTNTKGVEKEFICSDESINAYGYRVLTSGIDLTDFLKNPIALWNHNRAFRGMEEEVLPIGVWKDPKKEGGKLVMTFVADDEDEFAQKIGRKVEKGFLRACSIGLEPIEWSDDPRYLLPGQTRSTVTRCKLKEVSIVDLPANKNAVALYSGDGAIITLGEGAECPIPLLNPQIKMDELKQLGLALGLGDAVTQNQLTTLYRKQEGEITSLKAEIETLKSAEVDRRKTEVKNLLDAATADNRIDGTQRASWEKLFAADHESAANLLNAQAAKAKLADVVQAETTEGGVKKHEGMTFSELRTKAPEKLLALKASNQALFKDLYKSEYGKEYQA